MSDFARLETDTKAAETTSQKKFNSFSDESEYNKASLTKDLEHKNELKSNQEGALAEAKDNLDGTEKELDSANVYYEKLKPSCLESSAGRDDTVARRKEEIESLQEALRVLNGEEIPGF